MKRLTKTTPRVLSLAGIFLLGLILFAAPSQEAHAFGFKKHNHHHNHNAISFGIGTTHSNHYVSGYWAYRTENVLVAPARYEQVWVEPLYKEFVQKDGTKVRVKIREGYLKEIYIPAQYEPRTVKYWVPGYYAATSCNPGVRVGFGFRF